MKIVERENEIVCDRAACSRRGKYRFSAGGPPGDDLVLCEDCALELYEALRGVFDRGSGSARKRRAEDERAGV